MRSRRRCPRRTAWRSRRARCMSASAPGIARPPAGHAATRAGPERARQLIGGDRHRRSVSPGGAEPNGAETPTAVAGRPTRRAPGRQEAWRDYALRGDGSVQLPDAQTVAAAMEKHGQRYDARRRSGTAARGTACRLVLAPADGRSALTRAVFGDPPPGRRRPPWGPRWQNQRRKPSAAQPARCPRRPGPDGAAPARPAARRRAGSLRADKA